MNNYPEKLRNKLLTRKSNAEKLKVVQLTSPYYQKIPIIQDELKNSSIQCAASSVEIKYTEDLGRHIVATNDIDIGEIIAIETPFCTSLVRDFTTHCHECLQLCYNLLPCRNCTQAMFCSQECMLSAKKYHRFECKILKTTREFNLDKMKAIALKIALTVTGDYDKIQNDNEEGKYCSDRYEEIHNLVGNTKARRVSDLFQRATAAAILYYLVKQFSNFFQNEKDESFFREILLLHMQTSPCNFHEISEMCDTDGTLQPYEFGAGAFSFLSMFNHSCNPNVVRHCHGKTIVLRAIRSIKKGDQCFDNYG